MAVAEMSINDTDLVMTTHQVKIIHLGGRVEIRNVLGDLPAASSASHNASPPRLPAPIEVVDARRIICAACPRNKAGRCADCISCGTTGDIETKIAAALECCPAGKWGAVTNLFVHQTSLKT